MNFIDTLNGREKALMAWITIAIIFILINKKTRSVLLNVVKAFVNKKVFIPFVAMLVYSVVSIWILKQVGIWNTTLLKDTLLWLFGTATVLFLNTNEASRNPSMFKKMLLETVVFTMFLEFLAGLYSFSFVIEFVVLPFLFVVANMSALADSRDEYMIFRKPLKIILGGYGLFILFYSVLTVLKNLTESLTVHNLLALITPSLLSIMYLPFIYLFALIMSYETLFVRLGILIKNERLLFYSYWKILGLCHLNLWRLNMFSRNTGGQIMKLKNKKDILKLISRFRKSNSLDYDKEMQKFSK